MQKSDYLKLCFFEYNKLQFMYEAFIVLQGLLFHRI